MAKRLPDEIEIAGARFTRGYRCGAIRGHMRPTDRWDSKDGCRLKHSKSGKWTFESPYGFPELGWHATPKDAYVAYLRHQLKKLDERYAADVLRVEKALEEVLAEKAGLA